MSEPVLTKENYAQRPHVLIVDDDRRIRELLGRYLGEQGYVVMDAPDAAAAKALLGGFAFDVLVVDVMMPGQNGVEFTRELRGLAPALADLPVLMLTARGETENRIEGLEAGADDYLAKPFEPRELLLRLQAILKRRVKVSSTPKALKLGRWVFDPALEELQGEGSVLRLTTGEAILLRALAQSPGEVLAREVLAQRCGIDAGERTIDVQVTRLRRKIEEDSKAPRVLLTVRGKGYLLRTEEVMR